MHWNLLAWRGGPALPRAKRSRRFSKACDSISMVQPLDDVETRIFWARIRWTFYSNIIYLKVMRIWNMSWLSFGFSLFTRKIIRRIVGKTSTYTRSNTDDHIYISSKPTGKLMGFFFSHFIKRARYQKCHNNYNMKPNFTSDQGTRYISPKRGETLEARTWRQRHCIITSGSSDTTNERHRIAPIPPLPADSHS